jgi:hypothetical protein
VRLGAGDRGDGGHEEAEARQHLHPRTAGQNPQKVPTRQPRLNFELSSEQELKAFCEYVEKAVVQKFNTLRGEFVFELLVDKLK